MMNVAFSEVIGAARAGGRAAARKEVSPPMTVRATPELAAFRKFLRE
jgi:hypothetical protein